MSVEDSVKATLSAIRLYQNMIKEAKDLIEDSPDILEEPLYVFSDYLLKIGIDLTDNTVYETLFSNGELASIIQRELDRLVEKGKVNDKNLTIVKAKIQSIIFGKQIEESLPGDSTHSKQQETGGEKVKYKDISDVNNVLKILFPNEYKRILADLNKQISLLIADPQMENYLESFKHKLVESRPHGTEVAITRIITTVLRDTNPINRVIRIYNAVRLIPKKDLLKLFSVDELSRLEKLYIIALGLKRAVKFKTGRIYSVSVSFPTTEKLSKLFYFIGDIYNLIKYTPLTLEEYRFLKKHSDPDEIVAKILYRGVSIRTFNYIYSLFETEAHRVVNDFIRRMTLNIRMVKYYLEQIYVR